MDTPLISSVYLTNVERIPLSLCCISGVAIVVNFIQCIYGCDYCPWEANLSIRSAKVINLDLDLILAAIDRYKPDLIFLNSGDLWRYKASKDVLLTLSQRDALIGVKAVSCPYPEVNRIYEIIDLCDIILVEVCRCTDVQMFFNIVDKILGRKHVEVVAIVGTNNISKVEDIVNGLINRGIHLPINLMAYQYDDNLIYGFIDTIRRRYPLIHTLSSSAEFSSILCPKCRLPIVVRDYTNVLKVSIDSTCRCMYCGYRVINTEKNVCRARRVIRVPVNVIIA